jgi:hypothetical protein
MGKVRENNKNQNRAEVENSFLKRKQRAGSKVDGKKQRQKYISRGNPRSYIKEEIYMCVLTGEQGAVVWLGCLLLVF